MDQVDKSLVNGVVGLGLASLVLGAVRGYQEANGVVSEATIDSTLINMALFAPTITGALVGAGMSIPVASEQDYSLKPSFILGGATIGATTAGVAAYTSTPVGYEIGKIVGYIASCFG